tara:strand:- start:2683 stop:3261 length:579 start_codon:yes stop_codon:yes gene_type:complete
MSNIVDIVKGIQQAYANSYDGSLSEDGEKNSPELSRDEQGKFGRDRTFSLYDNYSIKIHKDILEVVYNYETMKTNGLKLEAPKDKIEQHCEESIENIVSHLKKEYKKVTGESLSLSSPSKVKHDIQDISRHRAYACSRKSFKIGGMDTSHMTDPLGDPKKRLDDSIKNFLDLAKKAKKPQNVSISEKDNQKD